VARPSLGSLSVPPEWTSKGLHSPIELSLPRYSAFKSGVEWRAIHSSEMEAL
jgi:hypothetical protein